MTKEKEYDYKINKEFKKLTGFLSNWYEPSSTTEICSKEFLDEFLSFQKFHFTNSRRVHLLFDHSRFHPIYISDNVIFTGFSPQDYYNMTLFQLLKLVYWSQISAVFKMHVNGSVFRKLTNFSPIKNHEVLFCGIKLKDKWGKTRTYIARQKFLSANQKGEPLLSYIIGEEITAIFKGDDGWMKLTDNSGEIPIGRVYSTNSNINIRNELLSKRETEILKLVVKNMNSAMIGKELNISTETVNKHRKNMISKVGAKDMTALIYLCQKVNII